MVGTVLLSFSMAGCLKNFDIMSLFNGWLGNDCSGGSLKVVGAMEPSHGSSILLGM